MFVCPKCKKIYKMKDNNKIVKCRTCPDYVLIEIGVSDDIWVKADPNDKKKLIETAILDAKEKLNVNIDDGNDNNSLMSPSINTNTPICHLNGVRGRKLVLYKNKVEIITNVTPGSIITSNVTDGEKTIFFIDCVGVQFKKSGALIGYLQFETPSAQMNNLDNNMFSENTFTYESGKHNVTNKLIEEIYKYVCCRMEGYKYHDKELLDRPLPSRLRRLYCLENDLPYEVDEEEEEQLRKEALERDNAEEKLLLAQLSLL